MDNRELYRQSLMDTIEQKQLLLNETCRLYSVSKTKHNSNTLLYEFSEIAISINSLLVNFSDRENLNPFCIN